jgi:hypothetical protein
MVICEVPIGVLADALTLKATATGLPAVGATTLDGWN